VKRLERIQRRIARCLVVLLVLALLGSDRTAQIASARAEDPCPEPNDTFQQACYLDTGSPAQAYIGGPDDIDAYRFETRDFGAKVHVALTNRPVPYRLSLANYTGEVLASNPSGVVDATLDMPGSYYVFVDSGTGQFDANRPYRISASVTYPSGQAPRVIYSHEFDADAPDSFQAENAAAGARQFSDDNGTYTLESGRIEIKFTATGTSDAPVKAQFALLAEPPDPGPTVDDFTMTIDTRMLDAADAGYSVLFRLVDYSNFYQLDVKLQGRQMRLSKLVDGNLSELTEWKAVPNLRTVGVNRTIVRGVGKSLRVNINGQLISELQDDSFSRGMIGFGATTWSNPTTVNFDNILVTNP